MKRISKWLRSVLGWLGSPQRRLQLAAVFFTSILLGWGAGLAVTFALEAKDIQYRQSLTAWDWFDVLAGLAGGMLGTIIHAIIF